MVVIEQWLIKGPNGKPYISLGSWNNPQNPYLSSGRGRGTAGIISGAGQLYDWDWVTPAQRAFLAARGWGYDAFVAAGWKGGPATGAPAASSLPGWIPPDMVGIFDPSEPSGVSQAMSSLIAAYQRGDEVATAAVLQISDALAKAAPASQEVVVRALRLFLTTHGGDISQLPAGVRGPLSNEAQRMLSGKIDLAEGVLSEHFLEYGDEAPSVVPDSPLRGAAYAVARWRAPWGARLVDPPLFEDDIYANWIGLPASGEVTLIGLFQHMRTGGWRDHDGIDILRSGSDVRVIADGIVEEINTRSEPSKSSPSDGGSTVVIVGHQGGWKSRYYHLAEERRATFAEEWKIKPTSDDGEVEGTRVVRGQRIGTVGRTGTDNVHLHFELHANGAKVDPFQYVPLL